MTIVLGNKRTPLASLQTRYPDARIIDVTSRGAQPWVKCSPFYPHGHIPVPLSPGHTAAFVEGIWQGLKVFATADIDLATFANTGMRGIKRTTRTYGEIRGHRAGVEGTTLLSYRDARFQLYLPAYRWVLDYCLQDELAQLRRFSTEGTLVLLDYEMNADVENMSKPLSHAALIIRYLNKDWPVE
jgi:hypothetical protein